MKLAGFGLLGCLLVGVGTALGQAGFNGNTAVLEGVDRRPQTSLNGDWHTMEDPYGTGLYSFHHELRKDGWFLNQTYVAGQDKLQEYNFAASPTLKVPGDWNTQRDGLFLYEGIVWYQRDFQWHVTAGKRVFLHVGAANYRSYFWVNGKKVCQHEGGFTSFDCEVTAAVKDGGNFVVAAVDDTRTSDGVPTLQTDWWNYGGLTREVGLVEVPSSFVSGYDLHLKRGSATQLEGWVQVTGAAAGSPVRVSVPELKAEVTGRVDATGRAAVSLMTRGLHAWTPEEPHLYRVEVAAGPDVVQEQMGFKTIETRGSEILLNGKPIFLRGISIHAEAPYRTGRAYSEADAATLLGWAKELGCNYVRLAHYPHDETMTRMADKLGLLVWSEIPTYWALEFENPVVLERARTQLREEIARDRNKVSVGLWSIANETPNTGARLQFLTALAAEVRVQDPERLVTAALLVRNGGAHEKVVDDPLGKALDVLGVNEYIGWYEGPPADADVTKWTIGYEKPVLVSEFGGGAKAGMHGSARFTEEYQAEIYRHNLPMLAKVPQVRGMSPWVLMDFRSPARQLPGVQDYFNRKGLVAPDGTKKLAFGVLQQAYKGGYGKAE